MRLAVSVSGGGPNLVLIHGWGLGPAAWHGVVADLAEHFSVHSVALPGYGDRAASAARTLDATADALASTLSHAQVGPAILCGWSLGAMVALSCAARHPASIRGLILVGANASFIRREHWLEALPVEQLEQFNEELERDRAALLQRFCQLLNHGDRHGRAAIRTLQEALRDAQPSSATLASGLEMLRGADLSQVATRVPQPTLLLHGAVDPLMPLAGARRLATVIPNCRLEVIAGAGHAPFASHPKEFIERLRRFAGEIA